MRSTPIAVWASNLENLKNYELFKKVTVADARFVHAHKIVHETIFLYNISIAHLLNNPLTSNIQ